MSLSEGEGFYERKKIEIDVDHANPAKGYDHTCAASS